MIELLLTLLLMLVLLLLKGFFSGAEIALVHADLEGQAAGEPVRQLSGAGRSAQRKPEHAGDGWLSGARKFEQPDCAVGDHKR